MGTETKIEWTDHTWNPLVGCSMTSPGCAHCYAETMAKRLKAMALADIAAGKDPGRKRHYIDAIGDNGKWSGKLNPVPESLADPLGWKKPRRVFVNSMSDLFHDEVPEEFIARVFATMYEAQWHTFQVLTKRAERMAGLLSNPRMPWAVATLVHAALREKSPDKAEYVTVGDIERDIMDNWPLRNVWLGVSVEDQKRADERIPHLVRTPAAVRFLSCEPLIGPVDLSKVGNHDGTCANLFDGNCLFVGDIGGPEYAWTPRNFINWVIVGGESGPNARPCDIAWIRDIVRQCKAAGVPCFVKQLGDKAFTTEQPSDRDRQFPVSGRWNDGMFWPALSKKGGDIEQFPADLRVREFPEVRA